MKYIIERNIYSKEQVIRGLKRSMKKGEISMKISPEEFIDKSLDPQNPELGTFEHMVKGNVISMASEGRMGEYIKKFKKLGINTDKLDKLYPAYQKYLKSDWDPPIESDYLYWNDYPDDNWEQDPQYIKDKKEYDEAYDKWEKENDHYEKVRKEFNDEVRRLIKIAKEKLDL